MRLIEQNRTLRQAAQTARNEIRDFRSYLALPKFVAPEDWVRCWEVWERLQRIDAALAEALEQTAPAADPPMGRRYETAPPGMSTAPDAW